MRRARTTRRDALLAAYVAPEVVAHIMSDGRTPLLSGVRLPVTVLFADIRGFTSLAERLEAERVVSLLDEFFIAMSSAALAHGAMIDKLIGDAIMLVYGVPRARTDDQQRAVATADAMHMRFTVLCDRWRRILRGAPPIGLAVGCAAGDAVLASVGSPARMDYTVAGSVVNRAARLTAAARTGTTLIDSTVCAAIRTVRALRPRLGRRRQLRLKGFRSPIAAYSVRPPDPGRAVFDGRAAVDPVCGMKLSARHALALRHAHRRYYFCSAACRDAFRRNPGRFARREGVPRAPEQA